MTKLSAEAYAIVEGRHSDPFHYLGLHTEDNKTVVRAFLAAKRTPAWQVDEEKCRKSIEEHSAGVGRVIVPLCLTLPQKLPKAA
jgi:hypothetical protein